MTPQEMPSEFQIYTRQKLKKKPEDAVVKEVDSPGIKNLQEFVPNGKRFKQTKQPELPSGKKNSKKSPKKTPEEPKNQEPEQFLQYKPDSAIIKTRDQDYDPDIDAETQTLFFHKVPINSHDNNKDSIPFSSPSKVTIPTFKRPEMRSLSKSSLDPERSKSPLIGDKKYNRYLYHPHGYFTDKGIKAKAQNIEKYSFAPKTDQTGLSCLSLGQGVLSKASRHQLDSAIIS